jgi:hypothetical protein
MDDASAAMAVLAWSCSRVGISARLFIWLSRTSALAPACPSASKLGATARAGNRRLRLLSAPRTHTKAPYKTDLHRKTQMALNCPGTARTERVDEHRHAHDLRGIDSAGAL